jgi:hypothetical protein
MIAPPENPASVKSAKTAWAIVPNRPRFRRDAYEIGLSSKLPFSHCLRNPHRGAMRMGLSG